MAKTIAITGSTGGILSHVCIELVKKNYNLILINRNLEKSENQNLEEKQKSPTYEYILSSVEKELNEGLTLLIEKRPPDPIKFLGNFLLEKSKNYK